MGPVWVNFVLFLPFLSIIFWLVFFAPFRSVSGIRTAPALLWRKICSLAMWIMCKCFKCRKLRILKGRVNTLFMFLFHPLTAISYYVARFFTVKAYNFRLFSFFGLSFGVTAVNVGIDSSTSFSMLLNSSSFSKYAIIWSFVLLSRETKLSDRFISSGSFA